jgi:hypothetical protein
MASLVIRRRDPKFSSVGDDFGARVAEPDRCIPQESSHSVLAIFCRGNRRFCSHLPSHQFLSPRCSQIQSPTSGLLGLPIPLLGVDGPIMVNSTWQHIGRAFLRVLRLFPLNFQHLVIQALSSSFWRRVARHRDRRRKCMPEARTWIPIGHRGSFRHQMQFCKSQTARGNCHW